MSHLTVYSDSDPTTPLLDTTDGAAIAAALAEIGVEFERWPARARLAADASDADVLAAYADEVERLKRSGGYQAVDVARVRPGHPDRVAIRQKFLSEHRHDEDEVRFFAEGAALFYLREAGKVHLALCETGDMISVPAGIRHWFDMGAAPRFTAIRFFTSPEGWVARYTGDPIADAFPRLEPSPA
jgi:1,2-dihydroxy-3-keto-5-methylthiopentene dioxygenase